MSKRSPNLTVLFGGADADKQASSQGGAADFVDPEFADYATRAFPELGKDKARLAAFFRALKAVQSGD